MKPLDTSPIVAAVRKVVGNKPTIGHHDALVTDADVTAVGKCARCLTDYKPVNDLERQLEATCKVANCVVMSSGTAALQIALTVIGVRPGDAVIVPSLTFAGAVAAIRHCGAEPVFVDVKDISLNPLRLDKFLSQSTTCDWRDTVLNGTRNGNMLRLTDKDISKGYSEPFRRVAAIVAVHLMGQPCDIGPLLALGARHGIDVIEDAAEALGSRFADGKPCGSKGRISILSFNYNKIVTGGGGGALLTEDGNLAARAYHLATTARMRHQWLIEHDAAAWNYRMPTMNAALALSQLGRLDRSLTAKMRLEAAYQLALKDVPGVELFKHSAGSNRWLNVLMVDWRHGAAGRDALLTALHRQGVQARALFTPVHKLTPYADCATDGVQAGAQDAFDRAVCLPSGLAIAERAWSDQI